jgi:type I restriction enzyme S subunit
VYADGLKVAIVDQGRGLIAGYTDDETLTVPEGQYIVFGDHTRIVKWIDFPFAVGADGTKVLRVTGQIVPKFAYYAMENLRVPDRGYNRHWTVVRELRLPVPPLEVQREIVHILDGFTQLEAELEAELEARRSQYQHYRSEIVREHSGGGEFARLGDVANIRVGFPFKSAQFTDDPLDAALVRGDNIAQGYLNSRDLKRWPLGGHRLADYELTQGDVVLAMDRPWVPAGLKWARIPDYLGPALLVQRVARIQGKSGVLDQDFLATVVSSPTFTDYVNRVTTGNTVPHLSGKQIEAFEFWLPSLDEQVEIADVLGKFDALVNGFSVGLPAELAARRKQYEYYRDKLLAFEEASA